MPYPAKKLTSQALPEKLLKKDRVRLEKIPFKKLIYISLGVSVATIIFTLIFSGRLPPQVPLYYGLAKGEEQLTSARALTVPSLFSLSFVFVNILIAILLEDEFLQKALVIAAAVGVLFSTITTAKIIYLVGSF